MRRWMYDWPCLGSSELRYRDGMTKSQRLKEGGKRHEDRTSSVIAVIVRKHAEMERLLNGRLSCG